MALVWVLKACIGRTYINAAMGRSGCDCARSHGQGLWANEISALLAPIGVLIAGSDLAPPRGYQAGHRIGGVVRDRAQTSSEIDQTIMIMIMII
jgi:hypothetical protein